MEFFGEQGREKKSSLSLPFFACSSVSVLSSPPPFSNPFCSSALILSPVLKSPLPPSTLSLSVGDPTTNGGMQNGLSIGICTHCTHIFCTFGADLRDESWIINKLFSSELSRKFIKSPLLVGERRKKKGTGKQELFSLLFTAWRVAQFSSWLCLFVCLFVW